MIPVTDMKMRNGTTYYDCRDTYADFERRIIWCGSTAYPFESIAQFVVAGSVKNALYDSVDIGVKMAVDMVEKEDTVMEEEFESLPKRRGRPPKHKKSDW